MRQSQNLNAEPKNSLAVVVHIGQSGSRGSQLSAGAGFIRFRRFTKEESGTPFRTSAWTSTLTRILGPRPLCPLAPLPTSDDMKAVILFALCHLGAVMFARGEETPLFENLICTFSLNKASGALELQEVFLGNEESASALIPAISKRTVQHFLGGSGSYRKQILVVTRGSGESVPKVRGLSLQLLQTCNKNGMNVYACDGTTAYLGRKSVLAKRLVSLGELRKERRQRSETPAND